MAVAIAQSMIFAAFNLKKVEYERRFSRESAHEGETVELIEIIRNRKILPVPWIRVESRISSNLHFGGGRSEEREIDADQYHRSMFFLGAFSQVTRRHEVLCEKRGYYHAGSVALTAGDLFSISQRSKEMTLPCDMIVYPRLLSEDELETPSTRWQGELTVKRWIMPDPFLMAGIRDYRAGDPLRDIHWRATARTGQLQVKVRDHTVDPRVMVVLNVQNSEEQWGELMDYEQEGVEYGIRVAATLCLRALSVGVDAGFASNACMPGGKGEGKTILIPARRTLDQGDVLLGAMARMLVHREISFPTFLQDLNFLADTDILILSTYDSPSIQRRMNELRARGNSVTLQILQRGTQNAKAG